MSVSVTYAHAALMRSLENWADGKPFDASEQISISLADRFGATEVTVEQVLPSSGFVELMIRSDAWCGPRKFSLIDAGSFADECRAHELAKIKELVRRNRDRFVEGWHAFFRR